MGPLDVVAPARPKLRARHRLLQALVLISALALGGQALCPGDEALQDPIVGHWQVTSIVTHDGTTISPVEMYVVFTSSGLMTVTLSTLGSTTSQYQVLRHERYDTILKVTTNGTPTQAAVEFDHKNLSMLSNGTTMFMSPVMPEVAAKPPPPPPPLTPYQQHGQAAIHAGALSGVMEGRAWSLVAATPNLLQDEGGWRLNLLGEKSGDEIAMTVPQLLVLIPHVLGRKDFTDAFNVTFFMPPSSNIACGNGYIVVTAITAQSVSVAVNVWLDDTNHLSGSFSFDPRTVPNP